MMNISNIKQMADNNIKKIYNNGITISAYSLNEDYFDNFEELVENNNILEAYNAFYKAILCSKDFDFL